MSQVKSIENKIKKVSPGKVFSAQTINAEGISSIRTILSRLEERGDIKRLQGVQGLYYIPENGLLGPCNPSRGSIINALLTGKKKGYITGLSLYNKLGLTTQVPGGIAIASDRAPRKVKIGNLNVEYRKSKAPITKKNIKLLQYLDVLTDIKLIPDASPSDTVSFMNKKIGQLEQKELQEIVKLSEFYPKRVQALLGAILEYNKFTEFSSRFKKVLSTGSVFNINVSDEALPTKQTWNIK